MNDNSAAAKTAKNINSARIALSRRQYRSAFEYLHKASESAPELSKAINELEGRYFYLLRYIGQGGNIPNYDEDVKKIADEIEILLHKTELASIAATQTTIFSGRLRYMALRPEENLESLISDYLSELDRLRKDTAAITDTRLRQPLERIANDIFYRLWVEYPYTDDTTMLLENILTDKSLPQHDRVMWIAALGLALQSFADNGLVALMLSLHKSEEVEISTAAAIWLLFIISHNVPGFIFNNTGVKICEKIAEQQPDDIYNIYHEWIRSMDTEQLSKEMMDNIAPRLQKLSRDISQKIGENPEISDIEGLMASELGVDTYDDIKLFAKAQSEGEDVFAATLGKMRHFDFFRAVPNWFLPFHTEHSAIASLVDSEGIAIADAFAEMPMLCDSDKFAMMLSLAQMPSISRQAFFPQFADQARRMTESEEARLLSKELAGDERKQAINNHIKNIYRFFNYFDNKKEFYNVLNDLPDLFTPSLQLSNEQLVNFANILFTRKRYHDVVRILTPLMRTNDLDEKMLHRFALACMAVGDKYTAAEAWEELLKNNHTHLMSAMHYANLLMDIGDQAKALTILSPFEDSELDNIPYLKILAKAYRANGLWAEAEAVYHNIDYHTNDDTVAADLAWMKALQGDFTSALELFNNAKETPEALQHKALTLWMTGQRTKAINSFPLSDDRPTFAQAYLTIAEFEHLKKIPQAGSIESLFEIINYRKSPSSFGNIL